MFCLLTLQLQAFAALALPCRHAADSSTPASAVSALHRASHCLHRVAATESSTQVAAKPAIETLAEPIHSDLTGQPAPEPSLAECQKCVLDLCVLGAMAVSPQPPMIALAAASIPSPIGQGHFYSYLDDLWSKPPIPSRG